MQFNERYYAMIDSTFEKLLDLYEVELRLLANPSCLSCDAKIRNPLALWHVGRDWATEARRILFVGKPHRGKPGTVRPSGVIDPREWVDGTLRKRRWPYWSYTQEIARLVHGTDEVGWARIAMTNIVKCTNVDGGESSLDATSRGMLQRCAAELGVISAEIQLLQPTHLVLYTASFYPEIVETLALGAAGPWRDQVHTKRQCGAKTLYWREREADASWGGPLRMLILGHPERMHRCDYTRAVADWVKRTG